MNAIPGYAANQQGRFECPECGGTFFSTRDTSLVALENGHPVRCKDERGRGCNWRGYMRPATHPRAVLVDRLCGGTK